MILQAQTISDQGITPTITPKEIIELGQQNQNSDYTPVIVLDFEGLGSGDYINDFYNGGTSSLGYSGTDYGIQFGLAQGLIDSDVGGTGNFANEPSASTVMYFPTTNQAYMNIAAGFTTGFAFYYASLYAGTVEVYSGLDGTGSLLASTNLPMTNPGTIGGDPNGFYDGWEPVSLPFSGTAMSVVFGGSADYIGFDDVTFGSTQPGGDPNNVPLSNWAIGFVIFMVIGAVIIRMRRVA